MRGSARRSLRLTLIAEESAGIQTLKAVTRAGHRVVAVLTSSDAESGRWTNLAAVARGFGVPVWPAAIVQEASLADRLRAEGVDLLLNVHSLNLIHEAVLAAPRLGAFNLHPGPLPERAGLNVPSWSIYLGETKHAVTVHRMVSRIDAGPIAYREDFKISEEDTGLSLFTKCVRVGVPLLLRLVEDAAKQPPAIPLIPQDLSRRRYFGPGIPDGGRLRWSRTSKQIVDFVRACDFSPFPSPWDSPRTSFEGTEIAILKAARTREPCDATSGTVGKTLGTAIRVASADEWVLVQRVKAGKEARVAADVLTPGQTLRDEG